MGEIMHSIVMTSGTATIHTTLYGTPTLEQVQAERQICQHRAKQLDYIAPKVKKEYHFSHRDDERDI